MLSLYYSFQWSRPSEIILEDAIILDFAGKLHEREYKNAKTPEDRYIIFLREADRRRIKLTPEQKAEAKHLVSSVNSLNGLFNLLLKSGGGVKTASTNVSGTKQKKTSKTTTNKSSATSQSGPIAAQQQSDQVAANKNDDSTPSNNQKENLPWHTRTKEWIKSHPWGTAAAVAIPLALAAGYYAYKKYKGRKEKEGEDEE